MIIAICLFIGLIITYFSFIISQEDTVKSNWGTFGDFIGGTLNPIFALFSLFAIIYTIKIQTKELELSREELEATRKELEGSRIAQQEQSESLKLQNKATTIQMFENTFFQLINLFIGIRNEFELEIEIKEDSSSSGKYKYKIIDLNESFTVSKPLEKLLFQGYKVIEVFLKC